MPAIAYVNGKFLPLDQATVNVEDRGLQFADSVYEVLRTYGGSPFALDEHLARLFRSLDALDLRHGFTPDGLKSLIREAVHRAAFDEAVIYLQITRGVATRHRGARPGLTPTIILTVHRLEPIPDERRLAGISVITVPDDRWAHCDIKTVALLANVLAYHAARAAGADDAVFVSGEGAVTETTAGNIFIITTGRLRTPPKGPRILAGVTRDRIVEAAGAAGVPCAEEPIDRADLVAADEVFLTSTTAEVIPVTRIDGQPVGGGRCGPVTRRVYAEFRARVLAGSVS